MNPTAAGDEKPQFPLVLGWTRLGTAPTPPTAAAAHAQTIRNVVEEGVLAEQVGVDFFGIGEHHTDYFPMPAVTWCSPPSLRAPHGSTWAPPYTVLTPTTRPGCSSVIRH
jgi:alkanesulfonate monooxygenase SsuD/methylene tetrahydromethanopterin reductase-like flavin-dependent oxidoreductase (luciferase family)